ncbi:MAG: hypothetical protein ACRD2L_24010, partial [Terriglobia bacterium]
VSEKLDFQLLADPFENPTVAAVQKTLNGVDADKLLTLAGDIPPGEKLHGVVLNETKDTPSSASVLSKGTVEFLEDSRSFKKFRIKGGDLKDISEDGMFVLVAEEAGSLLWQWERGQNPSRSIPETKVRKVHDTRDIRVDSKVFKDVQIWDPKKIKPDDDKDEDRLQLRPLALFQPMKAAARKTNEFHKIEDRLFRDFATDGFLKIGIVVQPKYNGWRVVIQKDEQGQIFLMGEDIFRRKGALRNNFDQNPHLRAEVEKLPGPFVLDAEFMAFDGDVALPRRDLAQFRAQQEADDSKARLIVHRALYLPGQKNMTAVAEGDMLPVLSAWLKKVEPKQIADVQTVGVAHTHEQLTKLVQEAAKIPGSEGAMLKLASSTYSLGGETDSWAKLKLIRTIRGIVWDRHEVKDSPGVYNFFYAFGPITGKDKENWDETVEIDGQTYVKGGKTFNRKLDAKNGDVIEIEVTEILFDR